MRYQHTLVVVVALLKQKLVIRPTRSAGKWKSLPLLIINSADVMFTRWRSRWSRRHGHGAGVTKTCGRNIGIRLRTTNYLSDRARYRTADLYVCRTGSSLNISNGGLPLCVNVVSTALSFAMHRFIGRCV